MIVRDIPLRRGGYTTAVWDGVAPVHGGIGHCTVSSRRLAVAAFLTVLTLARVSAAQSPPASPSAAPTAAEALTHYDRGRAYYATGRYRAAASELELAWRLDPSGTNLLFNLGTIYERMGDIPRARVAYATYLGRTLDEGEGDRTRRILTRLEGAEDELRALHRRRGRADALFFLTTGAALISTAIGVSWFLTDDSPRLEPAPIGLTVGGVSLGILATVLYFAREAPAPRAFYAPGN